MFAIGLSMGGIILANMLGNEGSNCFLDAAFVVSIPIKMIEFTETLRTSLYGFYDRILGRAKNKKLMLKHLSVMSDHYMK